MKLIVGLGNPGIEYEKTRHNAGFMAIDRLAARHAAGATPRGRFQAVTLEASVRGERCMLMKPTTYMNRSGLAVGEAVRFYKLEPADHVLILVDDVALPAGAIRLRGSGGAGGHNGLADLERALGSQSYARCRIGVDAPGRIQQKDYVLGRFTAEQWPLVDEALNRAADAAELWAAEGVVAAMNRFNAPEDARAPGRREGEEEASESRAKSRGPSRETSERQSADDAGPVRREERE